MTISSTVRKAGPFDGTGSQTEFPFEFKVFSAGDLYVVQYNEVTEVETVLELDSDYTVTLNADQDNDPGGTIELTSALAVNYTLTITSSLANLQPTDLTNRGGFYPSVINDALDRACIQIQQLQDETDRTLKTAVSVPDGVDNTLPMPAANMVIGWDNTGVALKNWSVNDLVTSVAYGSAKADIFTGDGETVDFYLELDPASINNLDVSVGGVCQVPVDDYTWTSGKKVTFTVAPPDGETVLIRYMQALPQATVTWVNVTEKPTPLSAGIDLPKKYKFLSGVVRNTGGTWGFIDDAGHSPTNLSSLEKIDVYTLRLNYGKTYSKISTFILNVDDALGPYGVIMGSDVGTAYANLTFAAPFSCAFAGNGSFTKMSPLWSDWSTVSLNVGNTGFTVTHPKTYGISCTDAVVVSLESATGNYPSSVTVGNVTETSFDVFVTDDLNGYVSYNGSSWEQTLSSNLASPTLTWTASNTLRVAHSSLSRVALPSLTMFGGGLIPHIVDMAGNYFEVAFYDYAGVKITTPSTSMKFGYRRLGPVPSSILGDMVFNCRRGYCMIPPETLDNVDGNNFWVFAIMEE